VWNLVSKIKAAFFQPMGREDVLSGPRNNDSDDIKTHFYIVFMTINTSHYVH